MGVTTGREMEKVSSLTLCTYFMSDAVIVMSPSPGELCDGGCLKGGRVFSRERGIENLLSNIIAHFIAIVVGAFDSRCERTQQWEEDDGSK